jgi:hypothetical protein
MKGDLRMNFQQAPGADLDVTNFRATVREQTGVGVGSPQTVIRTNQAWGIDVAYDVVGLSANWITGTWRIEGYLESIGAGGEFEIPQVNQAMRPGAYNFFMPVPAGFVAVVPGEPSTPFKLTVTLTAKDPLGNAYPMAGYEEGPIIQFFVP